MKNDDDDVIVTRAARARGRPVVDPRGARITTWLPVEHVERVTRIAHRQGVSLSSVIRRIVILRLTDPE